MKTLTALLSLLLIGSLQQIDAQQRRRTTTTRRTPNTSQRQARPAPRVIKEVAFYDVNVKDFVVTENAIFYLESGDNNALMRIDGNTGEITTVLPGIANVYEGRRPYFERIEVSGNRFMLKYANDYKWVISNGQNGWITKEWERVDATNGNCALIILQNEDRELWDIKEMKLLARFTQDVPLGIYYTTLDSANNFWWGTSLGVCRMTPLGERKFFSLANQSYVASEHIENINWTRAVDNYLYVSCKRRIYRMNMLRPGTWEEYCKVPLTIDYTFSEFLPNHKGDILTYNNNTWKECVQFYRSGAFDRPQVLGREKYIDTGMEQYSWSKIYVNQGTISVGLDKVTVDINNNYIISHGDGIRIYNPDGVVGYEKAIGKVIKP